MNSVGQKPRQQTQNGLLRLVFLQIFIFQRFFAEGIADKSSSIEGELTSLNRCNPDAEKAASRCLEPMLAYANAIQLADGKSGHRHFSIQGPQVFQRLCVLYAEFKVLQEIADKELKLFICRSALQPSGAKACPSRRWMPATGLSIHFPPNANSHPHHSQFYVRKWSSRVPTTRRLLCPSGEQTRLHSVPGTGLRCNGPGGRSAENEGHQRRSPSKPTLCGDGRLFGLLPTAG